MRRVSLFLWGAAPSQCPQSLIAALPQSDSPRAPSRGPPSEGQLRFLETLG